MKSDAKYEAFIEDSSTALGVDVEDVLAHGRGSRPVVEARKLIAWVLRARWDLSYPHIARLLCRADHTTPFSAIGKVKRAIAARERWALDGLARIGGVE